MINQKTIFLGLNDSYRPGKMVCKLLFFIIALCCELCCARALDFLWCRTWGLSVGFRPQLSTLDFYKELVFLVENT